MTTEKGSDDLFRELADIDATMLPVIKDNEKRYEEEQRLVSRGVRKRWPDREPGETYPVSDVTPPMDEPHDEFNPLP